MDYRIRLLSAPLLIAVYVLLAGLFSPPVIADTSDPDAAQPGDPVEEGAGGASGTAPRPTGLSVTSSDDDSISLSWTSDSDVARYRVEYRKSSSSIWLVRAYTYSASYTASNLDCDTEYYFRVRARGDGDPYSTTYSSASSSVSRTTSDCPSTLPTNLAVAAESNGRDLDVTFTKHTVTGSPHYYEFELHRSGTSSGTYVLADTLGANDSPADFDYQPLGYWYKARGRNCTTVARTVCDDEWTDFTTPVKISNPVSYAPAPDDLMVTSTTEDRVYLSWDSVTNADDYMVEYSPTRSGPWGMAFNGIGRTYYIAHGLKCSTGYFFRVRANGDGTPYSTEYGKPSVGPVHAVTRACTETTRVSAPTDVQQIDKDNLKRNKIKMDWTGVRNAVAYLTERSESRNGPWSTVRFPATVSARNDDVGLECGKTYYYRVSSRGSGSTYSSAYGEASTPVPARTASCLLNDLPDSLEVGGSDAFYVSVSGLDSTAIQTVRLTVTEDAAFDRGCTVRSKDATVGVGYTNETTYLYLYGCSPTEAKVMVQVLEGSTVLDTETVRVGITVDDMLTVPAGTPFLGQSVALTATLPTPFGTPSSYQFQKMGEDAWTDLGTAGTTNQASDRIYDEITVAYRVVVTNTSGDQQASPPLPVTWKALSVGLQTSSEIPVSSDVNKRKVTLTASTNAPAPFKYQFWQDTGNGFVTLGGETTNASKEVSFSTRGTRKFYAQVIPPNGLSNGLSNTVEVLWDGGSTFQSLMEALGDAIESDDAFVKLRRDLMSCMNPNPSGTSGNATSTPPLPGGASGTSPTYSSFSDLLGSYTGEARTRMENPRGCGPQADKVFDKIAELAPIKLKTLKRTAKYNEFLSTELGKSMESFAGNADVGRLMVGLTAYQPTSGGASGTNGGGGVPSTTGFNCLPSTEPTSLVEKLDDLDCMIFRTPHSFWANKDANETTFGSYPWMGIGDWMCTWPGFQGPVQSCLKHDVAFASLQKFTGYNPTNEPGGVANGDEMDEAWNPRNKSLADSKLYADILKHGCQLETAKARYAFCWWENEWIANYFFGGVGNLADKGWPVTEDDTKHIGGYRATLDADSSEYQFFPCNDLVPATTNAQVTHTHGPRL